MRPMLESCKLETTIDFQKKIEDLGLNQTCPKCGSKHIVKNGKRNLIQRYKCRNDECKTQFTPFTNTIIEKTKWSLDIWVALIQMVLNNTSLEGMRRIMEEDLNCLGIDHKTLFLLRHKIMHALAMMPQPSLEGLIHVDQAFVKGSQKGSRVLISYSNNTNDRMPRSSRPTPYEPTLDSEYVTIETSVDRRGHCLCKTIGLGHLSQEAFTKLSLASQSNHQDDLNHTQASLLRNELIKFIVKDMTNVSTKYLENYIGYFAFVHNWTLDHGHYPHSRQDAESILIDIIKQQGKYTITDLKNREMVIHRPTIRPI